MKNYKFICTFPLTGEAKGLPVFPVLTDTSEFIFSFIFILEITFKRNIF